MLLKQAVTTTCQRPVPNLENETDTVVKPTHQTSHTALYPLLGFQFLEH